MCSNRMDLEASCPQESWHHDNNTAIVTPHRNLTMARATAQQDKNFPLDTSNGIPLTIKRHGEMTHAHLTYKHPLGIP